MATIIAIPELLLSIPAPQIDAQYIAGGKLTLPVSQSDALCRAYKDQVQTYLRSSPHSLTDDIIPAVELALRLFNAENFSGELVPAERAQFAKLYTRFGAGGLLHSVSAKDHSRQDAEEQAEVQSAAAETELRDAYLRRLLTSDGEMAAPCVRLSGLLLCLVAIASATEECAGAGGAARGERTAGGGPDAFPVIPHDNIWRLRVHFRHQLSLVHRAHTVFLQVADSIDALLSRPSEEISVHDLIEVGHAQNYYHQRDMGAETFRRALALSGLELEESAMLGVRTRWQKHQLVQRILNAKSTRPPPPESEVGEQPTLVMSEKQGHDLLDRPREMPDAAPLETTPLHPDDKAIILALCSDIQNNNPYHGLTRHHMLTYVERIFTDPAPAPFMITCQTLLIRARLEMRRNRVQERAFMQLTELVDQHSARRDPTHETFSRTDSTYFYVVAYPSVWALKREYGDMCFEENLFKTALDMYEQVLDWEKIIECCKKLDKRRRAESLARDLLERDPDNPLLWVALGEATHDDAHLWKAWELCQHRMAAPMRALAQLAFGREHYAKVVEYFDLAVAINPIFGGDWFTLGYAALRLRNWERSGEAFTRVCQIDPNDAYAWNNLASLMLREKKLRPAFNAMSQALRNNRRDWRMWQNYFQIGCQLKEITETTNALNIILDIGKRSVALDRQTLEMFVDNTIAYLRMEIPGTSADVEESEEVCVGNIRYKSHAVRHAPTADLVAGLAEGDDDAAATATEEVEDGGLESDFAGLQPFGADVEMPESFFPHRSDPGAEQRAELLQGILRRHRERVRALFARVLDMFVTDPDIYACAAKLFNYLDGPIASYKYRLKELRECQQRDQWERRDADFVRVVECLESTVAAISAGYHLAMTDLENPAALASPSHGRDDESAAAATTPSAADPSATGALESQPTGLALQEAVVDAFKQTQNNIKAALEVSEEHLESTPDYARLRALAAQVRSGLQEAKAAFI